MSLRNGNESADCQSLACKSQLMQSQLEDPRNRAVAPPESISIRQIALFEVEDVPKIAAPDIGIL